MIRCRLCLVLVAALVAAGLASAVHADDAPIRALLVIGGCCHDYKHQKDLLTQGISARANVEWAIAYDPDGSTRHLNPIYEKDDWAKGFDVVVHDECSADVKDLKVIDRILKPHHEGLPGVALHCAMHCYRSEGWPQKVTPWFEFTGLPSTGHGAQAPIAVVFLDKNVPITRSLQDWTTVNEELYNNSAGKLLDTAQPLARGTQSFTDRRGRTTSQEFVTVWTNLYNGKARVFGTTLGHNNATCNDPRYLDLVTNGLLWSVGKLDAAHLKPAKKVLLDK
ncbi:MAG: ThuA domain-containing protein [Thermoguttaceae bacterium]|jgi:type 1 glutamine amidotransferase